MKSKVESEIEQYDDADNEEVEYDYDESVDAGGPDVASNKGSKITLIAFSALLIAIVLYFLFFNDKRFGLFASARIKFSDKLLNSGNVVQIR